MASSSSATPRRIPGAPPYIFLEGAGISYTSEPTSSDTQKDPWTNVDDWASFGLPVRRRKEKAATSTWNFGKEGKGKGKEKEKEVDVPVASPYGDEELPVFGKPFSFGGNKAELSSSAVKTAKKKSLNPYEDMLAEADDDLDLYAEGKGKLKLVSFGTSSR